MIKMTNCGWIKCEDQLPEEGVYVLVLNGGLPSYDIAKIEFGLSQEERGRMKRGETDDPIETGWNSSGRVVSKRSETYRRCDQAGNNLVPYCFVTRYGESIFGQYVTAWYPIPKIEEA